MQNPGGLYGKVSPENFPNISDYRNPYIAEAIKILGYVNRFSRGVYRVQRELIENGNGEASFDFSLITAFRVVEKVSEKYFEEGFGNEDNNDDTISKTDSVTKPVTKPVTKSGLTTGLTPKRIQLILNYFENPNDIFPLMSQMQLSHRSNSGRNDNS